MSGGKIVVKQTFGINPLIRNCLAFTEDHFLAYSSGHQVIVINTESKEQSFISGTSTYQHQSLGITAIQCCLSKKLIAIAEKADPVAIVTFYDSHTLKKKKLVTYNELGSQEIRAISFSDDGKFMIIQGCSPDWNLVLWNIEKAAKIVCTVKTSLSDETPINQISFCPWDSSTILVLGKNVFRLYRLQDGQLKPVPFIPRRESMNCISHCWMPEDNLVIGTDTGDIMFIENFEYRGLITNQTGANDTDWIHPVYAIAPYARGFLIGTNNGELRLFERNEDLKERYSYENCCKLDISKGNAIAFAVGSDDSLACITSHQQLLSISIANALQMYKDNNASSSWAENILTSFHSPNPGGDASITGIDTALWKQSMVVTCGKDKTMRVWNISDKRMELMKEFEDEPVSLSVHPSGLYIALAFPEKILILSVLLDSIQVVREIHVRQCSFVKFSRGGHHLACATGTHLQLYNTFTGATTGTLRAHNNKIKTIVWLNYDARIVTIGSEGVIYSWDLFPVTKRPEQHSGTVPIAGGCGLLDGSKIYIATQDRMLREINLNKSSLAVNAVTAGGGKTSTAINPTIGGGAVAGDSPKNLDLGHNVGCMIYDDNKKMLLIGTVSDEQPGSVLSVSVATHLGALPVEVNAIHSGYITAMCQSYDGTSLYTGDSNGVICINEFENTNNTLTKQQTREGMPTVSFEFIEEVMLQKSDLDARKKLIEDLTIKVDELHQNNLHQLRLKDLDHLDHKKEIEDKFTQLINIERIKFNELDTEKRGIENDFTMKVKKLEASNIDELRLIEFKYKTKQNQEENRYKQLKEETEEAHRRWNDENHTLVESHQKYLQELTLEYEEKLLSEQHIQKSILVDKDSLKVTFNASQQDIDIDGDHEVAELKIRYDGKLRQEEQNALTLMQQHAIMTKAHETLLKDSNQQKTEIKRLVDKETRLHESIHSLEKDIQSHKKEIREREETITDKEKRIFDLKKKNQELEKFRFVLDYKIKELKLQIAPREKEIATMKTQISEMDLELEQYNKSNLALNLMIEELKLKLDGMKIEIKRQEDRCSFNERLIDKFKRDLQELWTLKNDDGAFKAKLIKIYRIYVQEELTPNMLSSGGNSGGNGSKSIDMEDPQKIYNRDREQMERSLDSLRRSLKAEALAHKRDIGKMMRESVMLTKELNNLRKQSRAMLLQKKAIEQAGDLNPMSDLTELMQILGVQVRQRPISPGKNNNDPQNQGPNNGGTEMKTGDNINLPPIPPSGATPPTTATMSKQRTTALKSINADGKLVSMNPINNKTSSPFNNTKKQLANSINDNTIANINIANTGLSRQDQWEAWREIQIQYDTMKGLEDQLIAICNSLSIDPIPIIVGIDTTLL